MCSECGERERGGVVERAMTCMRRERNHEGGRKRCRHIDTALIALGGAYLQADRIHHNNKSQLQVPECIAGRLILKYVCFQIFNQEDT